MHLSNWRWAAARSGSTRVRNDPNAPNSRGQSEPLAALVAVAVVCVVVSLYVGTLADVVGQTGSDRSVAAATMDGVWRDVSDEGVYESGTDIERAVSPSSIPDGYAVAVEVTVVAADGTERIAGRARLGGGEATTPPADAERTSRPVSVRRRPGDVRPGRITVEVWQ